MVVEKKPGYRWHVADRTGDDEMSSESMGRKAPFELLKLGDFTFNEIGESMVCQWGEINRIFFFSHQTWEVNGDESWAAIEKSALRPIISIMHPSLPHQAACRASEPQTSPGLRPLPATIANHLFKARYPLVISSLENFPTEPPFSSEISHENLHL